MDKKHLAIINSDPKEGSYGGVCPIMRNMHPTLTEMFEVDYYYLPQNWRRLPLLPGRLKMLLYVKSIGTRLKKYDFILSHIPEGSYAVSRLGRPYAHIYHGNTNPMVGSKYWFGKYFRSTFESFFKRIASTASLRYTVGPPWEGVKKLVNPIRHDIKPSPYETRRGFIYAGRLENGKNIDRIIRIYYRLEPDERRANPLTIAGAGTLENELKSLASRLAANAPEHTPVIFTGPLANPDLLKLDSTQKILLMASSHEGFPTAIAEALTLGVPVVTTDVGDIPSIIKNEVNGRLLTKDFDDRDYIKAIRDVLSDYDTYARNALDSSGVFDADRITKEMALEILGIIK